MELVIAASGMAPAAGNARGTDGMNQNNTITILQASLILECVGIGHTQYSIRDMNLQIVLLATLYDRAR